tara:strand:- start:119087 stop:119464 length:378 start_codon:yes stop_codon:yes gene_type:complete
MINVSVMKKILLLVVVFLSVSFAQAQNDKNEYVVDGDLIKATLYHSNGEVAQTGYYTKENKLHGEWLSFDTNGNKTATAQYNNGEKVGTWQFYQGEVMKEVTYSNSKISKVKTWESTDTRIVSYR